MTGKSKAGRWIDVEGGRHMVSDHWDGGVTVRREEDGSGVYASAEMFARWMQAGWRREDDVASPQALAAHVCRRLDEPCRFCGNQACELWFDPGPDHDHPNVQPFQVVCTSCDARGPAGDCGEEVAVYSWLSVEPSVFAKSRIRRRSRREMA